MGRPGRRHRPVVAPDFSRRVTLKTLAIVGASVRAAVFSALRAGFAPIGIDRFADWDLRRRAAAVRVEHYPEELETAIAHQPFDAWMYTGGLENYPNIVDRLVSKRPLWGNEGVTLRAVRDPFQCAQAFAEAGIPSPTAVAEPTGLPRDGSWLLKPLGGSGGVGIRPWRGGPLPPSRGNRDWFFQPRIAGTPCSAVFVGAGGRAVLLGATRQLVGESWTGASEFAYGGSIGPLELSQQAQDQWQRIGTCLTERFSLVGLFGVDALIRGGEVWPIEVNPRYPASVEVLERAFGFLAIQLHAAACCEGSLPDLPTRAGGRCVGKAILYAPADLIVPSRFGHWACRQAAPWPWPNLADVPDVGARIGKGQPVTTVFAEASDEAGVRKALRECLEEARSLLGVTGSGELPADATASGPG